MHRGNVWGSTGRNSPSKTEDSSAATQENRDITESEGLSNKTRQATVKEITCVKCSLKLRKRIKTQKVQKVG